MKFLAVPGGTFQMGQNDSNPEEGPVHQVTLEGFYVGAFEVTFNEYDAFCKATGRTLPDDDGWGRENRPVINVSWEDANAFADWLSQQGNATFSLPTEAQWEYFARAGTETPYWTGAQLPPEAANCGNCGSQWGHQSAPVGSFFPNPWGIYDTAGNVSEWTLDDIHPDYTGAPVDGSAWLSPGAPKKIHRGGNWWYPARDIRSAMRDWDTPDTRSNRVGFRLLVSEIPNQK
jgi:formylglycine-generating enzyme required for sulfatase activity